MHWLFSQCLLAPCELDMLDLTSDAFDFRLEKIRSQGLNLLRDQFLYSSVGVYSKIEIYESRPPLFACRLTSLLPKQLASLPEP